MAERPFAQKSTVRSRREAERRAAERRAVYEAAVQASRQNLSSQTLPTPGAYVPPPATNPVSYPPPGVNRPSLADLAVNSPSGNSSKAKKVKKERAPKQPKRLNANRRSAFYAFAATLSMLATALFGAPLFGQPLHLLPLIAGCVISLLLLERLFHWAPRADTKPRLLSTLGMLVVLILFGLGSFNQVVIDGKAYPSWSETAKAYVMAESMYGDLEVLRDNDRFLALPPEQARTHANEIKAAITSSAAVANKWNPSVVEETISEDFLEVMRQMNASADAQAKALDLLSQNLLQPDAARESTINATRVAAVESFVNASNKLRQASNPYGFDPTAPKGPVE